MKYLIVFLFSLVSASSLFSQNYLVDITNHPDSGIDCRNRRLVEQKVKSVNREEFNYTEDSKLIPAGKHTYMINTDGDIYEEVYSGVKGDKKKYSYKYDHFGNVIERTDYNLSSSKDKKEEFITVKNTRFSYTYEYGGYVSSVTAGSGRYSYKEEYSCVNEGHFRIFTRHNNSGDTVLKYDLYNNLIEQTALSPFTHQELKKTTYRYTYNKDKPVRIVKTSGECVYSDSKSSWKYNLEYTQHLLYDDNGNVKSILFLDSNNKPFKLYKYTYYRKET